MRPTPQTNATNSQGGGLFRIADGKNLFIVFALVTSLFLLWGFCNGMIDILNKHFQDSLHINKEQSGLVQFANYLAYFLMAIPAGLIARRFGYKGGIIVGLLLIASGAFWFIPATNIGEYWAFLLGLFIIAAGMTCLETIANPYTTLLGPPESGATRINIAQTFNGVGWILGPVVGAQFVFSGGEGANANAGLHIPYLGIAIFVSILLVVFIFSNVPDLRAEDESQKSAKQRTVLKPSSGQLAVIGIILAIVCGLLYFFIAPILGLIWAMLNLPEATLQPTKYGLLVAGYVTSFMLVSKNWDMFRRKHYTLGIGAQFLYVAAQTGIFSFFVNYVLENDSDVTKLQASHWLGLFGFGLFMFGRLCGSGVISQFKPHLVLAAYAAINVVLSAVMMGGGTLGLFALFGTFFFMSVMFPTIFALGIRGLGDYTKLGSSLIVMSIVGGAIAPPFMGHIADVHSMRIGMVVPLVCFVFIAIYGTIWQRLEARDAANGIVPL
jgi:FHS family L-fucose permease-like MFS transporter